MGHVLHGSATTTEAVRRAIQLSIESLRDLAKRYGIDQKMMAKWRNLNFVADELDAVAKATLSSMASVAAMCKLDNGTVLFFTTKPY